MTDAGADGILLTVAYDGTDFSGWQRQPGQRTVEDVLTGAIKAMDPAVSTVRGTSRTDAGVHAEGQRVAFDSTRGIDPLGWVRGLNTHLPDDVAVMEATTCRPGLDPRYAAKKKHYRYVLRVGEGRDPLTRNRAWQVGPPLARRDIAPASRQPVAGDWLDLARMREAALALTGSHDFQAFRASNDIPRRTTIRTITTFEVVTPVLGRPDMLALDVHGDAFMKNMVRILAGTLVDVGRGRLGLSAVRASLEAGADRSMAGPTAPPEGLTLVAIELGEGM